jgi:hypothetical protein
MDLAYDLHTQTKTRTRPISYTVRTSRAQFNINIYNTLEIAIHAVHTTTESTVYACY